MSEIAVSNSACLIALDRIGRLDLLNHSFKQVLIPPAVQREFGSPINWLSVLQIKDNAVVAALKTQIGEGESEAIALAMEMQGSIIILDDKKSRGRNVSSGDSTYPSLE